jgi:hypothetical protein
MQSLFINEPKISDQIRVCCFENESENQQAMQQPSTLEEGPDAILFLFTQSKITGESIDYVFQDPFAACLQEVSEPRLTDFFNGKCIGKCFFEFTLSRHYCWCLRKHISKLQTIEK